DPRTRGRRLDEHLRVLRGLLAGETVDFDGEFVSVETASIKPVPVPPIPIVVGGRAPAALRRAGRLADGWLGIFSTPGRFAERLAEVHAAAAEAGRAEECAQQPVFNASMTMAAPSSNRPRDSSISMPRKWLY